MGAIAVKIRDGNFSNRKDNRCRCCRSTTAAAVTAILAIRVVVEVVSALPTTVIKRYNTNHIHQVNVIGNLFVIFNLL